jgi:hypothetical protein
MRRVNGIGIGKFISGSRSQQAPLLDQTAHDDAADGTAPVE